MLTELPVPVVCSTFLGADEPLIQHLVEKGIPFLPAPERAAKAAWALCTYAHWRNARKETRAAVVSGD